jgi:hypothetical protein
MNTNTKISSNTSSNSSSSSSSRSDSRNSNLMLENLDLHIPRISEKTTAEHIGRALYEMSIANVEYVDIVATKNPETKEVLYYSAFVRLAYWGPERFPAYEFETKKTFKVYLHAYSSDPAEKYWVLYPNKNPLPRTRINIHQLAASTEKLFDSIEQLTSTNALQNTEIAGLRAENAELNSRMCLMQDKMELMMTMINKLAPIELSPAKVLKTEKNSPKQNTSELIHELFLRHPVQKQTQAFTGKSVVDDDDCMFSKPVNRYNQANEALIQEANIAFPFDGLHINDNVDDMEDDFLTQLDIPQPTLSREMSVSGGRQSTTSGRQSTTSGRQSTTSGSQDRVICSRDFCGNV